MKIKLYLLLGILFCNTIYIGAIDDLQNEAGDPIEDLRSKIEQIQAQINPPVIKSWLLWGGKWTLGIGAASLTTYCAFRWYFDLASPRDVAKAFGEVQDAVQLENTNLQQNVAEALGLSYQTVGDRLAVVAERSRQSLSGFGDDVNLNVQSINTGLLGVQTDLNQYQKQLDDDLTYHFEQQQNQVNEFGQRFDQRFNAVQQGTEQQAVRQQEGLDNVQQHALDANQQMLKVTMDLGDKSGQLEDDRRLLKEVFNTMGNQSNLLEN